MSPRGLSFRERLTDQLFKQVDASSLVFFRVSFGVIMLVEMLRFWSNDWIGRHYIEPDFYFTYYGFEWVHPWPGNGMYWHFGLLGLLTVLIIAGALYRLASILFFLAFSYVFLLDQVLYLNHFYFVILVSFLMMLVPANRLLAVDTLFWPKIKKDTVPAWSIWLIRLQLEIMLIFAGLVKVNPDWLRLEPLAMWLYGRDWPILGALLNEDWVVALAAYGTIALHLVGAPLLLYKPVRAYVIVIYFMFHIMNHFLFSIGIFPWISMAGTLIFLEPDWPRQVLRRVRQSVWPAFGTAGVGFVAHENTAAPTDRSDSSTTNRDLPSRARQLTLLAFIAVWLLFQIFVPLRHLLYPGSPSWTEEGHRFAWQMKLRDKQGTAVFFVRDPANGREWSVLPEDYLASHQVEQMDIPDIILQFAHHLARIWEEEENIKGVEVRARICVSLNGRKPALLIDPNVDLARVERNLRHASWILPLKQPFERPARREGLSSDEITC